jgi:hypothetical protein
MKAHTYPMAVGVSNADKVHCAECLRPPKAKVDAKELQTETSHEPRLGGQMLISFPPIIYSIATSLPFDPMDKSC